MINLKQFSLFLKNIEFLLDIVRALSYNNKVANIYAAMAQMVERVLGKDEVTGSNPVSSSKAESYHESGRILLFNALFFSKIS